MVYIPEDEKVLLTEEQLGSRLWEIAQQIATEYKGKKLALIGILNGALYVPSRLIKINSSSRKTY